MKNKVFLQRQQAGTVTESEIAAAWDFFLLRHFNAPYGCCTVSGFIRGLMAVMPPMHIPFMCASMGAFMVMLIRATFAQRFIDGAALLCGFFHVYNLLRQGLSYSWLSWWTKNRNVWCGVLSSAGLHLIYAVGAPSVQPPTAGVMREVSHIGRRTVSIAAGSFFYPHVQRAGQIGEISRFREREGWLGTIASMSPSGLQARSRERLKP